ncbi:hypothetical protein GCM10022287_29850 [Gryllotalpicola koreensis]|uniref:Uncharacterized protein n=1 Tax=Gryllotalpicola koreensis TaxID=993086 RepID=A0ABP8A6C2_9MICO
MNTRLTCVIANTATPAMIRIARIWMHRVAKRPKPSPHATVVADLAAATAPVFGSAPPLGTRFLLNMAMGKRVPSDGRLQAVPCRSVREVAVA